MLTTEGKSMLTEKQQPFSLGGTEIQPGQRAVVDIPFVNSTPTQSSI